MSNKPLISIIIPTYNRKKLAERLIKSVIKSTYKNIEIILIDDASPDGTMEYLKSVIKDNRVRYFKNNKNLFASGSRNVGLGKSKGDIIFFVDDDNVVEPDTVELLAGTLIENENIGEVGPVIYRFKDTKKVLWLRSRRNMWTSKTYHEKDLNIIKNKKIIDTIDIPNAYMVKKSVLDLGKIQFRKTFGIMYEESDLAYRIKKMNYRIVVNCQAKIYHDLDEDNFILDSRRPFVFARNRVIFHKLYSENFLQFIFIALFWSWLFAAYYIYSIFSSNKSIKLSILSKVKLSFLYIKGIIAGITISVLGGSIE